MYTIKTFIIKIIIIIVSIVLFFTQMIFSIKDINKVKILDELIKKNESDYKDGRKTINENIALNGVPFEKQNDWELIIPKIDLDAEIKDGIDEENLNLYIGHFPQSGINCGNIALAAHNRGYNVNYFSRLKELNNGDEIIYRVNGEEQKYIVYKNYIIEDTDIYVIENTQGDIITLITCVEDKPQLRRCIQGKLVDKKIKLKSNN